MLASEFPGRIRETSALEKAHQFTLWQAPSVEGLTKAAKVGF